MFRPAREARGAALRRGDAQLGSGTHPAGLPLGSGRIRTRTHDAYRHGTICLFAAPSHLEGNPILGTEQKHAHLERLRFLKQIQREVPKQLAAHFIADNQSTFKHAKAQAWLKRHKQFQMHCTPTLTLCLNLGERFFAGVAEDRVRAGSFTSVKGLANAITSYSPERNKHPQAYRWRVRGWNRLGAQSAHCETPSHTGQAFPWPHSG
ncbi:MAG: hypothetical protein OXB91_06845 [Bryobacterales bacterium]|nr:hypothetical protein [Bryobacterales bacterium]